MKSLDYAFGGELLDRFAEARRTFDGDAWVDLFTPDAESCADPFEPPLAGHNQLRRELLEASEAVEQVEFAFERHWVVPPTILAAWRESHVHRRTRARIRLHGFLTLDVADDGRVRRARYWYNRRETASE